MALNPTLEEQQLVEAARARRFTSLRARERKAETLLGAGFALACILLALVAPPWDVAIDPRARASARLRLRSPSACTSSSAPATPCRRSSPSSRSPLRFRPRCWRRSWRPCSLRSSSPTSFAAGYRSAASRWCPRTPGSPSGRPRCLPPQQSQATEATALLLVAMVAAQFAIDATMSGIRDFFTAIRCSRALRRWLALRRRRRPDPGWASCSQSRCRSGRGRSWRSYPCSGSSRSSRGSAMRACAVSPSSTRLPRNGVRPRRRHRSRQRLHGRALPRGRGPRRRGRAASPTAGGPHAQPRVRRPLARRGEGGHPERHHQQAGHAGCGRMERDPATTRSRASGCSSGSVGSCARSG